MTDKITSKFIHLEVVLDDQALPVEIRFTADDQPDQNPVSCKGMLLSLFDTQDNSTLKLDLWSKEMQVIEMDRFIFQTLKGLADTYNKSTQNSELANEMQKFIIYFGERIGVVNPEDSKSH